jgi:fructose-1,6-bisphosphatase/inositol monophosphatase family enzyme
VILDGTNNLLEGLSSYCAVVAVADDVTAELFGAVQNSDEGKMGKETKVPEAALGHVPVSATAHASAP